MLLGITCNRNMPRSPKSILRYFLWIQDFVRAGSTTSTSFDNHDNDDAGKKDDDNKYSFWNFFPNRSRIWFISFWDYRNILHKNRLESSIN